MRHWHVGTTLLLLLALAPATPSSAQRLKLPVSFSELEKAAERDTADGVAQYNLGLGHWSKKRWDEAEQAFTRALELDPRLAPAHVGLAFLPYARHKDLWDDVVMGEVPEDLVPVIEASDRHYRAAFMLDPLVDLRLVAAVMPGKSLAFAMNPVLADIYDLLFRGFDDFSEGKYDQAVERFNTLMRRMEWDQAPQKAPTSVLWHRGLALAHAERWVDARADLQVLLDRAEDAESGDSLSIVPMRTNDYRYVLAYLEQRAGKHDTALRLYREAITADIGLYMAHVQVANIHESQRNFPDAIKARRAAMDANPGDPSLARDLGLTLGIAGQRDSALEALAQAAEGLPLDPPTRLYTGILLADLGRTAEAREALELFLALAPPRYERQITLARTRLQGLQ